MLIQGWGDLTLELLQLLQYSHRHSNWKWRFEIACSSVWLERDHRTGGGVLIHWIGVCIVPSVDHSSHLRGGTVNETIWNTCLAKRVEGEPVVSLSHALYVPESGCECQVLTKSIAPVKPPKSPLCDGEVTKTFCG